MSRLYLYLDKDEIMNWRKSSYSGSYGNCVEVAKPYGKTLIRDSKIENGPIVSVSQSAWSDFLSWM